MLDSMIKTLQLKIVSLIDEAELQVNETYEEFKEEYKDDVEDKNSEKRDKDVTLFKKNMRRLSRLIADFECEE